MTKKKIHSRNKGLAFERDIARRMRRWFPDARRGLQFQDTEYCPDIINTPFFIECKRYAKKLPGSIDTLYEKYLKQSIEYEKETGKDLPVVIIYKLDKQEVTAVMLSETWRQLWGYVGEIEGRLTTIRWGWFAGALDHAYPIKQADKGEK